MQSLLLLFASLVYGLHAPAPDSTVTSSKATDQALCQALGSAMLGHVRELAERIQ